LGDFKWTFRLLLFMPIYRIYTLRVQVVRYLPEFRYFFVCFFQCGVHRLTKKKCFLIFFFLNKSTLLSRFYHNMSPSTLKIIWNLYYFTKVVEIYALACRGAFTTLFSGFACSRISCWTSPSGKFVRKFQVFKKNHLHPWYMYAKLRWKNIQKQNTHSLTGLELANCIHHQKLVHLRRLVNVLNVYDVKKE
jgi:hypothetical protein